ncbi:MAG: hypothetical protein HRT45_08995 [Bdellovibrionales bacterium]|nr:hypothetical protein [Bdellovibrionales bacterium]
MKRLGLRAISKSFGTFKSDVLGLMTIVSTLMILSAVTSVARADSDSFYPSEEETRLTEETYPRDERYDYEGSHADYRPELITREYTYGYWYDDELLHMWRGIGARDDEDPSERPDRIYNHAVNRLYGMIFGGTAEVSQVGATLDLLAHSVFEPEMPRGLDRFLHVPPRYQVRSVDLYEEALANEIAGLFQESPYMQRLLRRLREMAEEPFRVTGDVDRSLERDKPPQWMRDQIARDYVAQRGRALMAEPGFDESDLVREQGRGFIRAEQAEDLWAPPKPKQEGVRIRSLTDEQIRELYLLLFKAVVFDLNEGVEFRDLGSASYKPLSELAADRESLKGTYRNFEGVVKPSHSTDLNLMTDGEKVFEFQVVRQNFNRPLEIEFEEGFRYGSARTDNSIGQLVLPTGNKTWQRAYMQSYTLTYLADLIEDLEIIPANKAEYMLERQNKSKQQLLDGSGNSLMGDPTLLGKSLAKHMSFAPDSYGHQPHSILLMSLLFDSFGQDYLRQRDEWAAGEGKPVLLELLFEARRAVDEVAEITKRNKPPENFGNGFRGSSYSQGLRKQFGNSLQDKVGLLSFQHNTPGASLPREFSKVPVFYFDTYKGDSESNPAPVYQIDTPSLERGMELYELGMLNEPEHGQLNPSGKGSHKLTSLVPLDASEKVVGLPLPRGHIPHALKLTDAETGSVLRSHMDFWLSQAGDDYYIVFSQTRPVHFTLLTKHASDAEESFGSSVVSRIGQLLSWRFTSNADSEAETETKVSIEALDVVIEQLASIEAYELVASLQQAAEAYRSAGTAAQPTVPLAALVRAFSQSGVYETNIESVPVLDVEYEHRFVKYRELIKDGRFHGICYTASQFGVDLIMALLGDDPNVKAEIQLLYNHNGTASGSVYTPGHAQVKLKRRGQQAQWFDFTSPGELRFREQMVSSFIDDEIKARLESVGELSALSGTSDRLKRLFERLRVQTLEIEASQSLRRVVGQFTERDLADHPATALYRVARSLLQAEQEWVNLGERVIADSFSVSMTESASSGQQLESYLAKANRASTTLEAISSQTPAQILRAGFVSGELTKFQSYFELQSQLLAELIDILRVASPQAGTTTQPVGSCKEELSR